MKEGTYVGRKVLDDLKYKKRKINHKRETSEGKYGRLEMYIDKA